MSQLTFLEYNTDFECKIIVYIPVNQYIDNMEVGQITYRLSTWYIRFDIIVNEHNIINIKKNFSVKIE